MAGKFLACRDIATPAVSFAPNQLMRQGAKLVTNGTDVIEDLATPVRARLVRAEQFAAGGFAVPGQRKIYEWLNSDEAVHIDDIVERSGLNSSEVLATLFDLERKGIVRQMPVSSLV